MSRRSPFMFAFQSPYGRRDTIRAFAEVLTDMFTTEDGVRMIQRVERMEDVPIVSSGLYIRPYPWGGLDLFAGNRAERFWTAVIAFEENSQGTYGQVMMDRPKNKIYQQYKPFAALNIGLPNMLRQRASFKIVKWDNL